jgi:hypothetical protein
MTFGMKLMGHRELLDSSRRLRSEEHAATHGHERRRPYWKRCFFRGLMDSACMDWARRGVLSEVGRL